VHRTFAGILGTAAFATTILRGWAAGGDAAAVLPRAATVLVIFGVLGAAAARLALWMVEEGVAAQLHETLALNEKNTLALKEKK
jgi:hypothetical protein